MYNGGITREYGGLPPHDPPIMIFIPMQFPYSYLILNCATLESIYFLTAITHQHANDILPKGKGRTVRIFLSVT